MIRNPLSNLQNPLAQLQSRIQNPLPRIQNPLNNLQNITNRLPNIPVPNLQNPLANIPPLTNRGPNIPGVPPLPAPSPLPPPPPDPWRAATERDYSVAGFLSHFRRGVGRSNRFRVELMLPRGIPSSVPGSNREAHSGVIENVNRQMNGRGSIDIKCHTATFPQRALLTQGVHQNSHEWRVPYTASYDPVTFSFFADSQLDTRDYFDVWQSTIVNLSNNTMNFLSEYVTDVKIIALDTAGRDTYGVTLYEAYPLNIGSFDYSYSSGDPTTVTVTLSYKTWLPFHNDRSVNRTVPEYEG